MGSECQVQVTVVYGVVIKLPDNPSWLLLCKRLLEVDLALLATAARTGSREDLEDGKGHLDQIYKSARIVRSVLVSRDDEDAMTEKERAETAEEEDFVDEGPIESNSKSAINKILGKGHGLQLGLYTGDDVYWGNDQNEEILLLEHVKSRFIRANVETGATSWSLTIPTIEKQEQIDGNIDQVLRALGMEAGGGPGWQLVATHSHYE
jgi:hypothetical protein